VRKESDEDLMRAVREGHVESLGVLFGRHHARVHALCFRLTRRADVADDLMQETFLRVLRHRDGFHEASRFSTWLYRLTYNVCHDHWRRDQRDESLKAMASAASTAPDQGSAMNERHVLLDEAMARLAPDRRSVLVLSRYHDLSYGDIAQVLECTPGAARVRAHRALHELREIYRELEQRPGALRAGPGGDRR
jgi:RNA polymerase sigma factor (sigma-70 family)